MRGNREWKEPLAAAGFILLVVGFIAYAIWFNINYRCAEEVNYGCTTTTCVFHDDHGNCTTWRSEEDTCTRCNRWEKR